MKKTVSFFSSRKKNKGVDTSRKPPTPEQLKILIDGIEQTLMRL